MIEKTSQCGITIGKAVYQNISDADFLREAIYLLNVEIKKLNSANKELIKRIENIEGEIA